MAKKFLIAWGWLLLASPAVATIRTCVDVYQWMTAISDPNTPFSGRTRALYHLREILELSSDNGEKLYAYVIKESDLLGRTSPDYPSYSLDLIRLRVLQENLGLLLRSWGLQETEFRGPYLSSSISLGNLAANARTIGNSLYLFHEIRLLPSESYHFEQVIGEEVLQPWLNHLQSLDVSQLSLSEADIDALFVEGRFRNLRAIYLSDFNRADRNRDLEARVAGLIIR